jgi:hypothetical protein
MNLVVGKTTFISFTRKTNSIAFTYKLDFSHIACLQFLKDLGGTFIEAGSHFRNNADHVVVQGLKNVSADSLRYVLRLYP